jgi:L-amino acid N-acyltransferase YncA
MIPSLLSASTSIHNDRAPEDHSLFALRKALSDDVPQISALFEEVYGDSYGNRDVYSAEHLTKKISGGELISIVAVRQDGRAIGHCAAAKENSRAGIAMASMSAVARAFRNIGCESLMLEAVIEEARKQHLWGLTSQSVTHHMSAQKAGQKLGFRRTGLHVGIISDRRTFDGKYPAPGRRLSAAIGYLPLRDDPKMRIYPPEHHREFISTLFKGAGLERIISSSSAKNDQSSIGRTSLKLRMITHDIAQIMIDSYGKAISRCVEEILHDLRTRDVRYISLYLPLGSPLTAAACQEFEELGFFICGVMPHSSIGDALILQYINNARVDYDDILVASEALASIKSYVFNHDLNRDKRYLPSPKNRSVAGKNLR